MEDFYTIENLKRKVNDMDFLKIQRMIYPFLKEEKKGNLISEILIENYCYRLTNNGIKLNSFNIDEFIDNKNEKLIKMISSLDKSIENYNHIDLLYTSNKIKNYIHSGDAFKISEKIPVDYLGNTFHTNIIYKDNSEKIPYIHYDYDTKMAKIASELEEKANIMYTSDVLNLNVEKLSYNEIDTLLTILIYNWNFENKLDELIIRLSNILKSYDKKGMDYNLNNLNLKYLNDNKLTRLDKILNLAQKYNDKKEYSLLLESEIDIELADMQECYIIYHLNDSLTILKASKLVKDEIKRRNSHLYNNDKYHIKKTLKI